MQTSCTGLLVDYTILLLIVLNVKLLQFGFGLDWITIKLLEIMWPLNSGFTGFTAALIHLNKFEFDSNSLEFSFILWFKFVFDHWNNL